MRNTRNKRRLAEIQDNFDGENSQSSSRERSHGDVNEEYISQVSQEIEGRIAKKLSQEFSKRESRILGALAKLDHFLTNPADGNGASTPKAKINLSQGHFGNPILEYAGARRARSHWTRGTLSCPRPRRDRPHQYLKPSKLLKDIFFVSTAILACLTNPIYRILPLKF